MSSVFAHHRQRTSISEAIRNIRTSCVEIFLCSAFSKFTSKEKTIENIIYLDKLAKEVDEIEDNEKFVEKCKALKEEFLQEFRKQFLDGKDEIIQNIKQKVIDTVSEISVPYLEKNPNYKVRFNNSFNLMEKSIKMESDPNVKSIITRPLLAILHGEEIDTIFTPEFTLLIKTLTSILQIKSNFKSFETATDKVIKCIPTKEETLAKYKVNTAQSKPTPKIGSSFKAGSKTKPTPIPKKKDDNKENNGEQNQEVKTSLFAPTNKSKSMFAPLGKSNLNKEGTTKNRFAPLVKQNENKPKNIFAPLGKKAQNESGDSNSKIEFDDLGESAEYEEKDNFVPAPLEEPILHSD